GLHAKGSKEVSRYIFSVTRVRLRLRPHSTDAKRRVARLQRGQIRELWSMVAKHLVRFPREQRKIPIVPLGVSAPVAAANLVSDAPKFLRFRYRQRLQHHLVHQRKDRRRRSDPQCQRNHCGRCEPRCFSQLSKRVAQIRQHPFLLSFCRLRESPLYNTRTSVSWFPETNRTYNEKIWVRV